MQRLGDLHFAFQRADLTSPPGPPTGYIEAVYRVNPIRIARRATLAKLIRSREETT
jgi:hypothetical protein